MLPVPVPPKSPARWPRDTRPADLDGEIVTPGPDAGDLLRYLAALYRRRWLAVGVLVVVAATALLYIAMATPIYEAHAKLLIESQDPQIVSFKEVMQQNTEKLDYYQTQLGILRSRTLARRTLDALHLWNHPELQQTPSALKRAAARCLSWVGWRFPPAVAADPATAESRTIDAFLHRLKISYRAEHRLVDAGFRSVDPRLAALVSNTLARTYIEHDLELRLQASKAASDFLNARLAEQRTQVEASELALQRYREANSDVSSADQQNVVLQKLAELSTAATHAKTERIEAEALYAQIQATRQNPGAAAALPAILSNAFVQQLKSELAGLEREQTRLSQQLGDRHPDLLKVQSSIQRVQAQLKSEVTTFADSARNQMLAAQAKERRLSDAVQAQEELLLTLKRRTTQDSVLQREVTSSRQIFEALLERAKQTEISSELKVTNIQLVDPAEVPETPAAPARKLILMLAVLIGFPLALAAVVAVEYFDHRIASPDEIITDLGVKFLGFSPAIPDAPKRALPLLDPHLSPDFAEGLRLVRANLFTGAPAEGTNTVLITSTKPEEGKTSIATNLAVSLAQAGRNVLLLDADMRRGRVHDAFEMSVDPGLSDVLQRGVALDAAVRPCRVPRLSILTAGIARNAPSDLLQRPAFTDTMTALKDRFDWIVIDAPPVMAASDAISLSQVANSVVFVVGARMTSPRAARAALEQLESSGGNIAGAVLSRADPPRHSAYYGYYSYPGYYDSAHSRRARR